MSLPILCKNVSEVPENLTLQSTNNESIFTIDPPLRLTSAQHYSKHCTLRTRGFFPLEMEKDGHLAQMLEKIRSQVGQCLWMMMINDMEMGVETKNTLSKALNLKEPLVRTPINQWGMLWLKPTTYTRATKWYDNSPIQMNSIGPGKYQFIIMVNQIFIDKERAVLQPRIDEFKYLSYQSYAGKRKAELPSSVSELSAAHIKSLVNSKAPPKPKLMRQNANQTSGSPPELTIDLDAPEASSTPVPSYSTIPNVFFSNC